MLFQVVSESMRAFERFCRQSVLLILIQNSFISYAKTIYLLQRKCEYSVIILTICDLTYNKI